MDVQLFKIKRDHWVFTSPLGPTLKNRVLTFLSQNHGFDVREKQFCYNYLRVVT